MMGKEVLRYPSASVFPAWVNLEVLEMVQGVGWKV